MSYQSWDEDDTADEVTDPDPAPAGRVSAYWASIISHVANIVIPSPPYRRSSALDLPRGGEPLPE
jgi:hypothetical protein